LNGPLDYRLQRMEGMPLYMTPLGPQADAAMDGAWRRLTDTAKGEPRILTVLGRALHVPQAANGAARFAFDDLCAQPLAAADYLAIAQAFSTLFVDRIPQMGPDRRDAARRFIVLIDTLYDEGVKFVCSAAAPPDQLYTDGDGADSFRRTASRLVEMQGRDYLKRGRGKRGSVR
jgi:cell division protein ZapE